MKIKVVIIDDDLPSVELLSRHLKERNDIILCGTADNLFEGEELVRKHCPDILFLDMEFPDASGLEWYEQSGISSHTKVVFHTCYQRYIHDALSLRVFDFLLKPFDPTELEVIIRRFKSLPSTSSSSSSVIADSDDIVPKIVDTTVGHVGGMRPLAITTLTNSKIIVNPAEIVYFRYSSERKIWECVFSNLKRIILKRQSTAGIILGYGKDFVRTHKHYIVNIRYVGLFSGNDCILLPPLDNITEIKISKSFRTELMDRFYDI